MTKNSLQRGLEFTRNIRISTSQRSISPAISGSRSRCLAALSSTLSRSCLDFSVLARQATKVWVCGASAPTHTSGVFTRLAWARCSRGIRHARRGLFAVLLTRLAWAHCSHGIRHAHRGLFAAFLTHLAWACCSRGIHHTRHGLFVALLTRLAWARCSCGICHAQRGLFAAFLTCLAWARCSRKGWSQCRSRG